MSRRRLAIIAAALFALAAIIFMPLRTIIGGDGMVARKVEGIVWDGSIRDLRVGRLALGDVNARLHILPLLLARAQISLSRGDAPFAPGLNGSVTRRIGGFSIDNLKASLPVASLFAPLPVETIELQDFSARFIAGRCAEAAGNARLTVASGIAGLDLSNGLLGKPRCERGQLLIPLLSQSAMERVDIRIAADGAYTATIFVEGDRAEQAAAIGLAGFTPVPNGFPHGPERAALTGLYNDVADGLATLPLWFLASCLAILGAIWGSFVAALCHRWPKGESVAGGRSRCSSCNRTIAAYDLVPIFSYLILRGKCRACGRAIGRDAVAIEIVASLAGMIPSLFVPADQAVALAILGWLLLPLIILDSRHLWLPDRLVLLLAVGGLLFGPLLTPGVTPLDRLCGAAAGYLVLQSVRFVFFQIRKVEGMGAGDPKLFGALESGSAGQALPPVLLLGSLIGLCWALFVLGFRKRVTKEVAFGTMLALGALAWIIGKALSIGY